MRFARPTGSSATTPSLRVGVVFGHGKHFTAGLDLMDVLPAVAADGAAADILPAGLPDPWNYLGEPSPKPVVVAAHGRCNTLGIELMLASAFAVAAPDTQFAQLEVARGIFPLGGGAHRLPLLLGKQGMRWLLTAETFGADDALAAGLLTEVAEPGRHVDRAVELAQQVAANAPLGRAGGAGQCPRRRAGRP